MRNPILSKRPASTIWALRYMNQQLFEKGLKEFQQAAQADPKFVDRAPE